MSAAKNVLQKPCLFNVYYSQGNR